MSGDMTGQGPERREDVAAFDIVRTQFDAIARGNDDGDLEHVDRIEPVAVAIERRLRVELVDRHFQGQRLDDGRGDFPLEFSHCHWPDSFRIILQ